MKLEGEGPQRCDVCLPCGDEPRISHHHSDGTGSGPTGPPERCERCGYTIAEGSAVKRLKDE
jgi:hypothetical protein